MDSILVILLVLAAVKFVVIGILLFVVFRSDIEEMRRKPAPASTPSCVYCQSKWTRAADEGQTRWESDELVLVTTYECQHCHLPFWHVERVPIGSVQS